MEKSYIPKGMVVNGDVVSDGDLTLQGEVKGNVSIDGMLELNGKICGKKLKVGRIELSEGYIQSDIECLDYIGVGKDVTIIGNIKATKAEIDGAIQGDIDIKESVMIGSTAVLQGDLIANEFSMDLGARCDVNLAKTYKDKKAKNFFDKYMEEHGIKASN